jgi:hypothetical protein
MVEEFDSIRLEHRHGWTYHPCCPGDCPGFSVTRLCEVVILQSVKYIRHHRTCLYKSVYLPSVMNRNPVTPRGAPCTRHGLGGGAVPRQRLRPKRVHSARAARPGPSAVAATGQLRTRGGAVPRQTMTLRSRRPSVRCSRYVRHSVTTIPEAGA